MGGFIFDSLARFEETRKRERKNVEKERVVEGETGKQRQWTSVLRRNFQHLFFCFW